LGTKNVINDTKKIIETLSALCWKPKQYKEVIQKLKREYKTKKDQLDFVKYFDKEFGPRFASGMLNYTQIDQHKRANCCLENYNKILQERIPKNPSWYDLVEGLKDDEFRLFKELIEKERKGEKFTSSAGYGKKYEPE